MEGLEAITYVNFGYEIEVYRDEILIRVISVSRDLPSAGMFKDLNFSKDILVIQESLKPEELDSGIVLTLSGNRLIAS